MSVNEVQWKKFMKLPVDHEDTWEGGIVEVPAQINEEGNEFTPEGAFWVSDKTRAIQPGTLQPPGELGPDDLFNQLVEFALNEQWGGYRPGKLVVQDETIADFLRDNLGDEVEIELQEKLKILPEVLEEVFDRKAPPSYPGYLSVDSVEVEHVRRLAEAGVSFYEARPWEFLGDTDVLAIEEPSPPVQGLSHATVMGQAGMEYGISFFSGLDQYENMMESDPEDEGVFLEHDTVWSLMFNTADHTPVDDMELWNSQGFPLVGDSEPRLPVFNCFDINQEYPQRPGVEELEYATALLIALSQMSPDDLGTGVFETQLSTGDGFGNCRIKII